MELYHGDCLDILKTFKDDEFDFCITDPPYGIKADYWDETPMADEFRDEIFRVSKNQLIFGGNHFNLPKTESWIVWYKQPFLPQQAHAELIWTSLKFKMKVFHYRYAGNCEGYPDNLKVDYKKKSVHPTQKPVEVMRWLIENFTKENQTIIDPFMGSGTTGIAAQMLNRQFVGIERDPEYYAIARQRCNIL